MTRILKGKKSVFTNEDAKALLETGEDIMKIAPDRVEDAWTTWATRLDVSITSVHGL